MKKAYWRNKVEKDDFYEDVIFKKGAKKEVKKFMAKRIDNLEKCKQIKIAKFKDLLKPLEEIVLPIRVNDVWKGFRGLDIIFTDAEGKEYYMIQEPYESTYIIGRRNSKIEPLLDRDFTFQISNDTITLIKTGILKLKEDGTNQDEVIHFLYQRENNITKVELESYSSNGIIKLQYPIQNEEFDKEVLHFLFRIKEKQSYYYNVFPILEWIVESVSETVSISIRAEIEDEVTSEIIVEDGVVKKYVKTEVIDESEIHIIKVILAKEIERFIEENRHL